MTCISVIFTIVVIVQTYARYVTTVSGNTNMTIARWNIVVNTVSIRSGMDLSNVIVPVFPGNENIAENVLAPTAEGYFDLVIDFSEVDVSFEYAISILSDEGNVVKDLIITGYSIDGATMQTFTGSDKVITQPISYTDDILEGTTTRNVRVYIMWDDNPETTTMNDAADTATTLKPENKRIN